MARRIEGTVAAGFVCDSADCSSNAIWAIIIVTPYLIDTETIRTGQGKAPILTFTDIHTCHHHFSVVRRESIMTEPMREAIRRIADERKGKPDFEHQWIARVGVHHSDYHRFQEMAGLISPGDQVISSDATMPDLPEWPGGH